MWCKGTGLYLSWFFIMNLSDIRKSWTNIIALLCIHTYGCYPHVLCLHSVSIPGYNCDELVPGPLPCPLNASICISRDSCPPAYPQFIITSVNIRGSRMCLTIWQDSHPSWLFGTSALNIDVFAFGCYLYRCPTPQVLG